MWPRSLSAACQSFCSKPKFAPLDVALLWVLLGLDAFEVTGHLIDKGILRPYKPGGIIHNSLGKLNKLQERNWGCHSVLSRVDGIELS